MSWPMMKLVLDVHFTDLTASEKFVLLALARYANALGGNIYPSVPTLADNVNLSVSQVRKILCKLEKAGYIANDSSRKGGSRFNTTVRRLNVPRLEQLQGKSPPHRKKVDYKFDEVVRIDAQVSPFEWSH